MAEKKRTSRPRPPKGVAFTVWSLNGGPLTDDIIEKLETAIETVKLEFFNEGHRLLSQTNRG